MKALVLGATGHIGAHVVRALLANGCDVRAAYRNPRYLHVLDGLAVERLPVDLDDRQAIRRAVDGCDRIFHCAGYYPRFTDRRGPAVEQGIAQIRRIFDVLRDARAARIVYTSSAATIAPRPDRLSTEEDREPWSPHLLHPPKADLRWWRRPSGQQQVGGWPPTTWRSLYATVKIAMERAVDDYVRDGLPVVITHPSLCIGAYDAHPFSGRLVLLFAKGRLPVYLEHRFNVVYTGDVGIGHAAAAEGGRAGAHYLLATQQTSVSEFARVVAQEAGVTPPRWALPYSAAMAAAAGTELVAAVTGREPLLTRGIVRMTRQGQRVDGSKAQRELGVPATPMAEAIRRSLAWFRAHGYLR